MKWFQLAFIVAIICQCRTDGGDRPYTQMKPSRHNHDCLFCNNRPCPTCPKSQQNSLQLCPPCPLPPCAPCVKSAGSPIYRSFPPEYSPPFPGLSLALCTPGEIKARTKILVRKVAITLRIVCTLRNRLLLPPFRLVDDFCPFRLEAAVPFARRHLPELIGYLYDNFLISEKTFEPIFVLSKDINDKIVVVANPGEIICRPYIAFSAAN